MFLVLIELKLKAWGKVDINQLFTTRNVKQQNHSENRQAKVGSVFRTRASLVAQMVKNRPARWETHVWPLGQEDPLEERLATHSSILAWKIPRTEEPGGLQSMGSQGVGHNWAITVSLYSIRWITPSGWGIREGSRWCRPDAVEGRVIFMKNSTKL